VSVDAPILRITEYGRQERVANLIGFPRFSNLLRDRVGVVLEEVLCEGRKTRLCASIGDVVLIKQLGDRCRSPQLYTNPSFFLY